MTDQHTTPCDLEGLERLHSLATSPEDCYGDSAALRAASITRMQAAADLDEIISRHPPSLIAEIRGYREALERSAEGWANVLELDLIPKQHRLSAEILRDEARAVLKAAGTSDPGNGGIAAKAEGEADA